jgi:hypothetical protein
MKRSFLLHIRWVGFGLVFLLMIMVIGSSVTPLASAMPAGQVQSDPPVLVYLPLTMNDYQPPPPTSSFELIDIALQEGKIDAETALEYKTFVVFDDDRLPAAYQSSEVGGEAGLFMLEVVAAYPSLSAEAQAVLGPFFIPPFQAGSFAAQSGHNIISTPSDWAYIDAAGGLARVWYLKADPELQRKAGVVAAALTNDIWPNETALMGRTPIPDDAGVQNVVLYNHTRKTWNGTFVPWGNAAGSMVPKTCSQTMSTIYIRQSLPDTSGIRSGGKIGLIEATAHEFMHALQFSFPLAVNPCTDYDWLGEATATWAEDFVYPDHDSEHRTVLWYLNKHIQRINNRTGYRDYGEYLLVYYYTHKYNDPDAVRRVWASAGSVDSLMAFMSLGDMGADQIASLWNEKPFGTFFRDQDEMYEGVATNIDTTLKTTGFKEYVMVDDLYPGGLRVYHYKVDPSVRTITFLNGLTTKIEQGPYSGNADDIVYNQSEVAYDDMRGANVVVMLKYEGLDEAYTWVTPARLDICQDWLTQRVSEILVFMTNQDMSDSERMLQATGGYSRILVSSAPCMKLTGTATRTDKWSNVTETLSASGLEYQYIIYDSLSEDFRLANLISPEIGMILIGGSVSWNIGGTDSNGCTYSGSDSFTITRDNSSMLTLQYQLLPGSRHFLGYVGNAGTDYGEYVTYTVQCPNQGPQTFDEPAGYFFMADGETPVGSDGKLSGSRIIDNGGGNTTQFEWNLTPSTLP